MQNKWIENNKEAWKAYTKEWYLKNKNHLKDYAIKNKTKIDTYQKEWRIKNKEYNRKRLAEYYLKNKDKIRKDSQLYAKQNAKAVSKRRREFYQNNKDKIKVVSLVFKAIKKGTLIKLPCQICNKTPSEAHHEDYSKPYQVIWLCKPHHAKADI